MNISKPLHEYLLSIRVHTDASVLSGKHHMGVDVVRR